MLEIVLFYLIGRLIIDRASYILSMRSTISYANVTNACAPRDDGSNTTPGKP